MTEFDQREELHAIKRSGCGRRLAGGQFFTFCGEMDMGQTDPALCTECGGELKPDPSAQPARKDSDTHGRYTSEGAIHTRGADTHGPSVAMCSMDTHGHLRFAGDRAAIYALQAAVAERFSADLAIHTGPIHTEG